MQGDPPPQLRDMADFACLPSAARWARKHTVGVLHRWQLCHFADTAELLVSELVTNAYRASGVDVERNGYAALARVPCISMRVASDRRSLLIEVWDANPEPPVLKEADVHAEGGRGLLLVDSLAERWNFYFPLAGGKVVWCEIAGRDAP
ncbi:Anti-sigma regulatory factor (Ser/Thr protein kinase) [Thermomonospora echinospora]|uniref:Anti-sigma regulatory factor (Ser/Thr protein kinase) n=1 Tax=Thermomonospora echinospora TaxID=1992 RepID=A0A1H6AWM2_9ACTN|nr:ATP-binding protein [Thermomonospora echinospora]SEG52467.1 Anti-sigma regulatory factor (Ser/Thr protein kinase) [Thermomonospora echinospora]